MKKFSVILSIMILSVICLPFQATEANAVGSENFSYSGSFDFDGFLEDFTATYPDRTADTPKERDAAIFMAKRFGELNLKTRHMKTPSKDEDYFQSIPIGQGGSSQNVIGIKEADTPTPKSVVIGAHYDNVFGYETINPYTRTNSKTQSNGAYDNASGLAVMLSVAKNLRTTQLPFNVAFVAFGAEEQGMFGSKRFIESLPPEQKNNILLMINLDCISAGDKLYLFCKDWSSGHQDYLVQRANELNIPLNLLPFNKKYTADPFGENYYSHLGYQSDNYYFMKENINTAFFMSMNWDSKVKAGVVESDTVPDIMHTGNDKYTKIKEFYPETYLLYMQYVSELTSSSLTHSDFVSAMESSKQNAPNYSFIMNTKYLSVGKLLLWTALLIFVFVYYGKLKKISDISVKEYMNDPENVKKMNALLNGLKGFSPYSNMQYPPNTYKPKKGESQFTVFGEEFEKKDENYKNEDYKENGENFDEDKK